MTNRIFKAVFQYPMLVLACVIALAQAYRASIVGAAAFAAIAAVIGALMRYNKNQSPKV